MDLPQGPTGSESLLDGGNRREAGAGAVAGGQSYPDSTRAVQRSLFTGWKMNLTSGPHIVSGTARREGDVWLVCGPHWQHLEPCTYRAWTWATQGELVRWAEAHGESRSKIPFIIFFLLFFSIFSFIPISNSKFKFDSKFKVSKI
jgi:hypothetical protein